MPEHDFTVQNIGVGLERSVCSRCGSVSIQPVPSAMSEQEREQLIRRAFKVVWDARSA